MKIKEAYKRGFSLVELLVVLAIMLILSLIAVGSYSNFRHGRRLRFGAEMVSSIFTSARSAAITTNGTYRVVFQFKDPQTGAPNISYWIDEIFPDPPSTDPIGITSPSALPAAKRPKVTTPMSLPTNIKITDITTTPTAASPGVPANYLAANYYAVVVRFFPNGYSDDANVYLLDSSTSTFDPRNYYTVKLYGITAKAKIFSDTRKP